MMRWIKKGLIFKTDHNFPWMVSYSQCPVADVIDENVLRIYFSTRDSINHSYTTFIEVDPKNPSKILKINEKPVLSPGNPGLFDDCGAMASSIVNHGTKKYLYYIGWNTSHTVPYRNSIGLAISEDGGTKFSKFSEGPILDRSIHDPYFIATPFVLKEGSKWKLWYLSCTGWIMITSKFEPVYNIKYAESKDGINWKRFPSICINYKNENEAIAKPFVFKEKIVYKMFYCYRGSEDYRLNKKFSYRIGYAESDNGIDWIRKDEESGIDTSEEGWDSEMIAYPYLYRQGNRLFLLYNGNTFGKSGIGYAELSQ